MSDGQDTASNDDFFMWLFKYQAQSFQNVLRTEWIDHPDHDTARMEHKAIEKVMFNYCLIHNIEYTPPALPSTDETKTRP